MECNSAQYFASPSKASSGAITLKQSYVFCETLLNRARLPTIQNRRLQDIAIYMYKVRNDLVHSSVAEMFSFKQLHLTMI